MTTQTVKKRLKTVIICRTNAPLVKALFDLIRKGRNIKARIVGRDVAKSLKDAIGEVLEFRRNCPITEFHVLLDSWIGAIRTKFKDTEGMEDYVAEQEDMYSCLKVMSNQCDDAKGLFKLIDTYIIDQDDLSDDDQDVVVLCSGHRAKGLEWDRAIILRADLFPHPNAESDADLQQEYHIWYVALTRGKAELWVCHVKRPD